MLSNIVLRARIALNKLLVSVYLGHYRFLTRAHSMEKLGTDYGGWYVPTDLIDSGWICYSGGAGEDISFDLALREQFGCDVWIFDPTPRAIQFVRQQIHDKSGIHFMPAGLWSSKTTLRFYQPRDPSHVSHSVVNLQKTEDYFESECYAVSDLMSTLGHKQIDLLKIDIEGAEHAVIQDMLSCDIRPRVLCIEIDQPASPLQCFKTLGRIREAGYELAAIDGWNFSFVREEL